MGVTLPLGTRITYLVNANTHLPVAARTEVTIDGTDYTPERVYREFREVEGVLFTSHFRQGWTPDTAQHRVLESAEVNPRFPENNLEIPDELVVGN